MRFMTARHRYVLGMIGLVTVLVAAVFGGFGGFGARVTLGHAAPRVAAMLMGDPVAAGRHVHVATCEQAPPQSVKDRATYTPAELARYGLPPRLPGDSFAKWAQIVRTAGKRVCDYTTGVPGTGFTADPVARNANWSYYYSPYATNLSSEWAGYMADNHAGGNRYTEADMDYFVPCIQGHQRIVQGYQNNGYATMASWIGIGGFGSGNLVQTGTAAFQFPLPTGTWQTNYYAWWQNVYVSADPNYSFAVQCGQHFYVKVWDDSVKGGCMYLQRISDGYTIGTQCELPASDEGSAEAVVEYRIGRTDYPNFADFGQQTFNGVGITDNGSYYGMWNVPNGSYQKRQLGVPCGTSTCPFANIGPVQYQANDWPDDQYTITWDRYCEGKLCPPQ